MGTKIRVRIKMEHDGYIIIVFDMIIKKIGILFYFFIFIIIKSIKNNKNNNIFIIRMIKYI